MLNVVPEVLASSNVLGVASDPVGRLGHFVNNLRYHLVDNLTTGDDIFEAFLNHFDGHLHDITLVLDNLVVDDFTDFATSVFDFGAD